MIMGQTLTLTRDDSLSLDDSILIYNLIPDFNCQRQGNQPSDQDTESKVKVSKIMPSSWDARIGIMSTWIGEKPEVRVNFY